MHDGAHTCAQVVVVLLVLMFAGWCVHHKKEPATQTFTHPPSMTWDVPFVEDAETDSNTLMRRMSTQNKGMGMGMGKLKSNVVLSTNPVFVCSGAQAMRAGACWHHAHAPMQCHACC